MSKSEITERNNQNQNKEEEDENDFEIETEIMDRYLMNSKNKQKIDQSLIDNYKVSDGDEEESGDYEEDDDEYEDETSEDENGNEDIDPEEVKEAIKNLKVSSSDDEDTSTSEEEELPIPFIRRRKSEFDGEENECEKSCFNFCLKYCYKGVAIFTFMGFLKCFASAMENELYASTFGRGFMVLGFILFVLSQVSFFKITKTHPGNGNVDDVDCTEEEKNEAKERAEYAHVNKVKCVDIGYPCRYCIKCKKFKKPRSYHCSKCGECIEMKDHHCCWVGNCVGKNNFKYFMLYLLYVTSAIGIGIIICVWGIVKRVQHILSLSAKRVSVSAILGFMTLFDILVIGIFCALLFSIGYLAIVYSENLFDNMTTMESIEKGRWRKLSDHPYQPPSYNRGLKENIKQLFGGKGFDIINPFKKPQFEEFDENNESKKEK